MIAAHLPASEPAHARELLEMIGAGWLVHASDYPHDHGRSIEALYGTLDDGGREAVLDGNAAELYRL
jgi:predicted TIM-barrel fold metal-dependent hydrolase